MQRFESGFLRIQVLSAEKALTDLLASGMCQRTGLWPRGGRLLPRRRLGRRLIPVHGLIPKPAWTKWWSVVNASRNFSSRIRTKLVQSVNEKTLSR